MPRTKHGAFMHTIPIERSMMILPSSQECSGQTNHTPTNDRVDSSTDVPVRTMPRKGIGPAVASLCSPVETKPAIVIVDSRRRATQEGKKVGIIRHCHIRSLLLTCRAQPTSSECTTVSVGPEQRLPVSADHPSALPCL